MKEKKSETLNTPQEKRKNPYKGLHPYEEDDSRIFFGRSEEVEKLFQLIRLYSLTLVLGKSGVGKTSLLNAGVFPRLRSEGYLPIRLILNYKKGEKIRPLTEQLRQSIKKELERRKIEVKTKDQDKSVEPFVRGETLWEYFHSVNHFDPAKNDPVKPVLVFDQFEQIFTVGRNHPYREELINELYWLIEDQFPAPLKEQVLLTKKRDKWEKVPSFTPTGADFRVIISLREDYLPHLTDLKTQIASIDRNLFRVTHLNGVQAREIISKPSGGFQDESTINNILRYFYPDEIKADKKKTFPDDKLEIDPVFLSLLCSQLFEKQPIEAFKIETPQNIFEDFYNSKVEGFDDNIKIFIESKLLTEGGFRTPFYFDPDHKFKEAIYKLVDLRVLRKSHDGQKEYIEISHDVLAPIIKEKRERRLAEKERKEFLRKTFRKFVYSAVAILILTTGFAIYQTIIARSQFKSAQVNRLTAEALVEFPKDSTRAMRIVEEAYKIGLPNPPARTYQVLSDIAYSSYEKPFYSAILRHNASIYSAVFSPDGGKILTASEDGTARVWDLEGKLITETLKHEARIVSAVYSPNGKQILTTSWDKSAKLWALDGKVLAEFKHNGPVTSAVFSSNGEQILTASRDNTAKLWNLQGMLVSELKHDGAVSSACFSPDKKHILTGSWDKTVKLWDMDGNLLQDFPHDGAVESAVFSPDGNYILTASWDKSAKLWNLDRKILVEFKHNDAVNSALFSRDGSLILTASRDGKARLWDVDNRELQAEFVHKGEISSAEFSPDGNQILTASKDGSTKLWKPDGTLLTSLKKHEGEVSSARFSPDGSNILTASYDGTAKVWELKSNLLVNLKHKDDVTSVTFSNDSTRILTTSRDKTAKLWDIEGSLLADLNKHKGVVYSAKFSPDSARIVTASDDGTAKVWDSQGKFLFDLRHNGSVASAVFSPNGKEILTASSDQSAKLWNLQGNLIKKLPVTYSALSSAIFSPGGNLILTVSIGGTIKGWDKKGKELIELPHNRSVPSVVFSPDGSRILTACHDGIARLWNAEGKLLKDGFKHNREVSSAIFSPNGNWILTASYDGTSKMWGLEGEQIVELRHDSAVLSAVFSAKGDRILTASEDGTAKVWTLKGELLANLNKHNGAVYSAVFSPDDSRILTASEDDTAKIWLTPEAIYQWLKTAKISPLPEKDKNRLGIR